jgi:GNAT superfamily N-acetyltransferase
MQLVFAKVSHWSRPVVHISPMRESNIPFAVSLTDHEHWGNLPADFSRILALNPQGCFVAWESDKPVGIIASCLYGDYAFLGDLIVSPDYRRKGIGEALMRHVIENVRRRGAENIELDATFAGVPLYRRLCFRDKYLSLRFRRGGTEQSTTTRPRSEYSLEEIVSIDHRLAGLDRKILLSQFVQEFQDSAYIARTSDLLTGYGFVYPRADGVYTIGPLVAESNEIAESLLAAVMIDFRHSPLTIGLLQPMHHFADVLLRYHFEFRPPSLRMYLGKRLDYEKHIYGISSADKG